MKLRIAYMTGEYPRATDTFIQREIAALRARGVEIETIAIRKPAITEDAEQQAERNRTFYVLDAGIGACLGAVLATKLRHPVRWVRACWLALRTCAPGWKAMLRQVAYLMEAAGVARHVRKINCSHLHNHFSNSSCTVAMLAAELGGFSFSFTMHGPAEFFEPHYWRIDEKIKRARFVCCISQFCRSQAMIFSRQQDWAKLHIIHCGVIPALFKQRAHAGEGTQLLFVGRLAAIKGLPILLDAVALLLKKHPALTLSLAGDGPDRRAIEEQARAAGIAERIRFLGNQSPLQVRELLATTDIFVMASFAEGVPVVLMEAMAAGVPVVATQIAGVPELVEDGVSGYLVPPGDVGALVAAIDKLIIDPEKRNAFGQAGPTKVAREFDVTIEAEKLHALFNRYHAAQS